MAAGVCPCWLRPPNSKCSEWICPAARSAGPLAFRSGLGSACSLSVCGLRVRPDGGIAAAAWAATHDVRVVLCATVGHLSSFVLIGSGVLSAAGVLSLHGSRLVLLATAIGWSCVKGPSRACACFCLFCCVLLPCTSANYTLYVLARVCMRSPVPALKS
jgi:hypothetical protein